MWQRKCTQLHPRKEIIMFKTSVKQIKVYSAAIALLWAVLIGMGFASRASADVSNKKTIVTFSTPVEIPGKTLPAGTYVFKVLDSPANRNIVQIFDKDEKQLYATVLAVPDYRLQPSGEPVLNFEERPAGTPPALRAWFYPGDNYGQQFVYPQSRATQLAKANKHNVLSMPDNMEKHVTATAKPAADSTPAPNVVALQKTEVIGVDKSGNPVRLEETVLVTPADTKQQ
jgi:hypothetical protein